MKSYPEELFTVEATLDEVITDKGLPFNGKEFASFFSALCIKHTISSSSS